MTPSQSSTLSATQESMQSEKKERGKAIMSYFRTGKRGAQDTESDREEEVATMRRSSRLEILNVHVDDVLVHSSEIIDVNKEGPQFLDNG